MFKFRRAFIQRVIIHSDNNFIISFLKAMNNQEDNFIVWQKLIDFEQCNLNILVHDVINLLCYEYWTDKQKYFFVIVNIENLNTDMAVTV